MKSRTILVTFVLFLFILSFSINSVAYNRGFYIQEFTRLGISTIYDDAPARLQNLLNYLHYKEELSPELYSERDINHMHDVRRLLTSSILITILALLILLKYRQFLLKNKVPLIITASIFTALLLSALFAFEKLFLLFHKISFQNTYWLMNPLEDTLINLFPEQFFIDALSRVFLTSFLFLALTGSAFLYQKVKA